MRARPNIFWLSFACLVLLLVGSFADAQTSGDVGSTGTLANWAAANNGGVATVSSQQSTQYPATSLNDGDRTGLHWGQGGGWQDGTNAVFPDWAQITFSGTPTIYAVTVYSLQDDSTRIGDPAESATFSQLGLTDFDVQVQNGSNWTTVASITNNNLVKRTVTFTPTATSAIRIMCNGGMSGASRIVEIEAWGAATVANVASNSTGAVANASSSATGFSASALNDGLVTGKDWDAQGPDSGWKSAVADEFPAWAEISFNGVKRINSVTVHSLGDNYSTGPTLSSSSTFTQWGVTAFDIQIWGGTQWTTVASVTGNQLVERVVTFAPVVTNAVRVICNAGLQDYARITELQVGGIDANRPPVITSFSPTAATIDSTITITGQNFDLLPSNDVVTIGGVAATVTSATSTALSVVVPKTTTGSVAITIAGQTATSAAAFIVGGGQMTQAAGGPTITNISPTSGKAGDVITVNGTGFDTTARNNSLKLGNTTFLPATSTATKLTFTIANNFFPGSSNLTVTVAGNTSNSASLTVNSTITNFTPTSGHSGDTITINGANFGSLPTVKINGLVAGVSNISATQFTAVVPNNSPGSYPIVLQTFTGGTVTSSTNFTYIGPPPTITSFTPTSGPAGQSVTITGTNFDPTPTNNSVSFNGTPAVVTAASSTSLTVTVPSGATTGPISVTVGTQTATSSTNFSTQLTITGFSPTSALPGASVTLSGTLFNTTPSLNTVKFNGVAATVTAATTSALTVTIPASAMSGTISVTANGQSVTSSDTFFVLPTITGFSPMAGPSGTVVTLSGTSFSTTASQNSVSIGGVFATITAATSTALTFNLPNPALGTYPFVLRVQAGPAVTSAGSFIVAPAPTITSFSPTIAPVGTTVTISGTNFSTTASANVVKFNGTTATVSAATTTSLTVTVPSGATTGAITETVNGQTATSPTSFTVGFPPPTITSFSPTSGPVGTQVTINGTNLTTLPVVKFSNNVQASLNSATSTQIVCAVPSGAVTGPITVTASNGLSVTSSSNFTVTPSPPQISGFSPASAPPGVAVTISGSNFATTPSGNTVQFNGVTATVTAATASSLTAVVPDGNSTGVISVTANSMVATSDSTFTQASPTIAGFSPTSGAPGAVVTISGTNFSSNVSGNIVHFQATGATITAASNTSLTVTVPSGATSGTIIIAVGSLGVTSGSSFTVLPPMPTIASFTPSGAIGAAITITGTNFGTTPAANIVKFNGAVAKVTTASATSLTAIVPVDATTGALSITVNGQTGVSSSSFTVTASACSKYVVSTLAGWQGSLGSADALGTQASFNDLEGIAVDSAGNVFVADAANATIRKISPTGSVSTFVGSVGNHGWVDATGNSARFASPYGLAIDHSNNLYVADGSNYAIRMVTPAGVVSTVAGNPDFRADFFAGLANDGVLPSGGKFYLPWSVSIGQEQSAFTSLYVSDQGTSIRQVNTPPGSLLTLAGPPGGSFGYQDGNVWNQVRFTGAEQIAVDASSNLFIADSANQLIRKLVPSASNSVVSTFAGTFNGTDGVRGNTDGTGTSATFDDPTGFIIDPSGLMFVASHTALRSITPEGVVTTIAGSPDTEGFVDGAATSARFNHLGYLAIDASGNLYVIDDGSVRKIAKQPCTAPLISGISPSTEGPNRPIVISGSNFGVDIAHNTVTFTGATGPVSATITSASTTSLTVTVPTSAVSGDIVVTTGGQSTAGGPFTFVPAPVITSISPTKGTRGFTSVLITGANFSNDYFANTVIFPDNSTALGNLQKPGDTSFWVVVPPSAVAGSSGPLKVQVGDQIATSAATFTIRGLPTATLVQTSGAIGDTVTITGTNFDTESSDWGNGVHVFPFDRVLFNGTSAQITNVTDTSITAIVPNFATSGVVTVVVGNDAVTAGSFSVTNTFSAMSITSFSPGSGWNATRVTLKGKNFYSPDPTQYRVYFGSNAAEGVVMTVINTDLDNCEMDVIVPTAATGNASITIQLGSLSATSSQSFVLQPISSVQIFSFSPNPVLVGQTLKIYGQNFATAATDNVIFLPGVWESLSRRLTATGSGSDSGGSYISLQVPGITGHTVYGKVAVQRPDGGSGESDGSLMITGGAALSVISVSPTCGTVGIIVTIIPSAIDQYFFQETDQVSFSDGNGGFVVVPREDYVAINSQQTPDPYPTIKVKVPQGAGTGFITVSVDGEVATSHDKFVVGSCNAPTPTVAITAPTNNQAFADPASLVITATASVAGDTIKNVDFYNGSTKICSALSAPYTCSWTNVPTGAYALTAQATGNLGGTRTSAVVNITVGTPTSAAAIPPSPTMATAMDDPVSDSVGTTKGQFSVDASGNAQYRIPIYAPRGPGGLTPTLALVYNSGFGDGNFGWGWQLEGISVISICRRGQEHGDGVNSGTSFNFTPGQAAYCLDGQRLDLVRGSEGTVGAVYRLENDSAAQITIESSASNTDNQGAVVPLTFAVYKKDGTITRFGGESARLRYQPNVTGGLTVSWYQYQIEDSNHNTIEFDYDPSGSTPLSGQPVALTPSLVHYAGGSISLGAIARSDSQSSVTYVGAWLALNVQDGAVPIVRDKWITSIRVGAADGTELRNYILGYQAMPGNPALQEINQVQECAGATCYAATQFAWKHTLDVQVAQNAQPHDGTNYFKDANPGTVRFADINGDGRSDVIWLHNDNQGADDPAFMYGFSTPGPTGIQLTGPNGTGAPITSTIKLSKYWNAQQSWALLDYNGDGRADLLTILDPLDGSDFGKNWVIYLGTANGFSPTPIQTLAVDANGVFKTMTVGGGAKSVKPSKSPWDSTVELNGRITVADFDGDGLPDVFENDQSDADAGSIVWLLKPTGNSAQPYAFTGPYNVVKFCNNSSYLTDQNLRVADFNGDGRSDLVLHLQNNYCLNTTTSAGFGADYLQVFVSGGLITDTNTHEVKFEFKPSNMVWMIGSSATDGFPVPVLDHKLFQIADFNGDGYADVAYASFKDSNGNYRWVYALNQGGLFNTAICVVNGCPTMGGAQNVVLGDFDGDGRADFWTPGADVLVNGKLSNRYPYKVYLWTGFNDSQHASNRSSGFSQTAYQTALMSGDATTSSKTNAYLADLDGDGHVDALQIGTSTGEWTTLRTGQSSASTFYQPTNVITNIFSSSSSQSGLPNHETDIQYAPLTFSSVYFRETDPTRLPTSGWGSPVQDVLTPRYVVQSAQSTAPQEDQPYAVSSIRYQYDGLRIQGGGRGALGFAKVMTFDAQSHVETVTTYNQGFPLTGTPLETDVYHVSGGWTPGDNCSSNGDAANCMTYAVVFSSPPGTQIGKTTDVWNYHAWLASGDNSPFATIAATPLFAFRKSSEEFKYNLDGGLLSHQTSLFTYNNMYQELTSSSTTDYLDATQNTSSRVRTVATAQTYGADVDALPTYHVGRLTESDTTATGYGHDGVVTGNTPTRVSQFAYDTTTGQLIAEHLQPAGTAYQALDKFHFYDSFGNEIEVDTCSASAACSSSAKLSRSNGSTVTFNSTVPTWVQRYTRSTYDANGIYVTATYAPFWTGSGSLEQMTSRIDSRDAFGNPTQTTDLHGVVTTNSFDAMGRPYFSASNTGAAAQIIYRWCTAFAPAGTSQTVACPAGAAYRVDATTFDAVPAVHRSPETWTYYDVLDRAVLKVEQGFSSSQFAAVSTSFDALGRASKVSEPYFTGSPISATPGSSTSQCGSSIFCTQNLYDDLGRPTLVTRPNGSVITTAYTAPAGGLQTFVTLPANGSLDSGGQPQKETKTQLANHIGQLVNTTDATGSSIANTYDASGNVTKIQRARSATNPDHGVAVPSSDATYDELGRKTMFSDSDAGSWSYQYNALGEQIQKTNSSARATCTTTRYDAHGRPYSRTDYPTSSCTGAETSTTWVYDTASNGVGLLKTSTSNDGASASEVRTATYDAYGRAIELDTSINGTTYQQLTTYDQYGRTFQTLFAGPAIPQTGELYTYTTQGYLWKVQDAEQGATGQVYQEILAQDARGHVTQERRGGQAAMTIVRGYDPSTGWLLSISSGAPSGGVTTGAIQNLSYTYDLLGNIMSRVDSSGGSATISESSTYDILQRLKGQSGTAGTEVSNGYDSLGNIVNNLGGALTYGATSSMCTASGEVTQPGVGAVSSVGSTNYCYDSHGNQTRTLTGLGVARQQTYSSYDALRQVVTNTASSQHTTQWQYGIDRQRTIRQDYANVTGSGTPTTTYYVGNAEILNATTATPTVNRYLPGLILSQVIGSSTQREYLFTDNLGSTHRTTDGTGAALTATGAKQWFGAFGNRADAGTGWSFTDWTASNDTITHHGFTGHEMMDESGLIHMNGRIYDPQLARFIQADPFVQDGSNLQNLNRYTYLLNNPLGSTDPTGYWGRRQQGYLREAVGIAIAIYSGGTLAGAAFSAENLTATIATGYLSGFVSGGGNLKSAVLGAFDAGLNYGIGFIPDTTEKVIAHAVEGGVMADLQGGNFGHGFFVAGVSASLSPHYSENKFLGGIEASIVGGTASRLTGGKFANGAMTAAFEYGFNELAHYHRNSDGTMSVRAPGEDPQSAEAAQSFIQYLDDNLWTQIKYSVMMGAPEIGVGGAAIENIEEVGSEASLLMRYLFGSGGRWGGSATRALNDTLATQLEGQGYTIIGGAGRAAEEWIPGVGGGTKGGTFVDITAIKGSSTMRIQTISTMADGVTPTASEAAAALRIRNAFPNDALRLVPKQ